MEQTPHTEKLRVIHRNLAERGLLKAAALTIGERRNWNGRVETQVSNLLHMLTVDRPRLHYAFADHEAIKAELGFDPAQEPDSAA